MNALGRIKSLLLIIALAFTASAAPLPPASQVLTSAIAAINKMKAMEAGFTAECGGQSTSGTILIAGGSFRLVTPGVSTWFDGHTQWSYSASADEVNISEPTFEELQQINPFAILRSVEKHFIPRRLQAPKGCARVELTPAKNVSTPYSKVVLTVDDTTKLPVRIDVTATDGVMTSIKINEIKAVKSPSASSFRFPAKQYPGVEVIDLR